MIRIELQETGYVTTLKHAQGLPERVREAAAVGLRRGMEGAVTVAQLQNFHEGSSIQKNKLRAVTGRLRKSIVSKVDRTSTGAIGRIGTNVVYAGYHEYGFHGVQHVREHLRAVTNKPFRVMLPTADPRRSLKRGGAVVGFKESLLQAISRQGGIFSGAYGVQRVKAHTRKVNYAGRPFLRPALESSLPSIIRQVEAELATISPP